jgi:hypothetical protein
VAAADGTHGNNPAFDEFDAVVVRQNTGFGHAVVFVDRE